MANAIIAEMREEALEVVRAGAGDAPLVEPRSAFMRYVGQGHEIVVALPARALTEADAAVLREAFEGSIARCSRASFPMGRSRS